MKFYITRGCSSSGKSSWARENVGKLNAVIVERDNIRTTLFGVKRNEYKYSKNKEKLVTEVQDSIIETSVKNGYNVIISDTNINDKTLNRLIELAKKLNCDYEVKDFIVDLDTIIKRNNLRGEEHVPIQVLRDMYNRLNKLRYVGNEELPKAIIFDLDGTLADNSSRHPFDYDKLGEDIACKHVKEMLELYKNSGYKIVICSGRPAGDYDKYKIKTTQWLKDNNIYFDDLYMRKNGDIRKDFIVKEEILFREISKKYNVVMCVDDRQQVVDMWRSLGIKTLQVNYGDF